MKRGMRIVAWLAATVALLAAVGICVDSVFDWESAVRLCKVPVRSVIPSPNGKQSVVVFEVYCGPVPPENTHASVVSADMAFSWKRNPSFLVLGGSYNLAVQWTGESSLQVNVPATAKVFKNEASVGQVTANYRPVL